MTDVDPILVEILQNRFRSLTDQANENMMRTAISPVISEIMDCSVVIWNGDQEMLAMASSIPTHLQSLQYALEKLTEEVPPATLSPEDVLITNDPYLGGGQHLPDIATIEPIFHGDDIVGYVGAMAHHMDIGGKTPGGYPETAEEIYEEGLRIPPLKIFAGGSLNEDLMAMLVSNVRTSDENFRNDLTAQVAACHFGRDGYLGTLDKYGMETTKAQEAYLLETSEERARREIEQFPDGRYQFSDTIESPEADHTIRTAVEVSGSEVIVDYTGTDPAVERFPLNCMMAATKGMSIYSICTLLPETIPKNGGTFKPISVTAPTGCIVNPQEPTACSNRNLIGHRIPDLIYGALADALPHRVMAACYGSTSGVRIYYQDEGQFRNVGGINPGGWGATANSDGEDVCCVHVSNTKAFEMEVIEREAPILVHNNAFRQDSGGAGRQRGGMGLDYRLEFTGERGKFVFTGGRHRHAPFGLHGGEGGATAKYRIKRVDSDSWRTVGANEIVTVQNGDVVWYQSAGGGGFGDPKSRDPARVLEDYRNGNISATAARERYGVDVESASGTSGGGLEPI